MEATQAQLLSLLDGKKQFIIPIYQRTYSWKLDQCRQLLKDILRVGQDHKALSHFIGSIVYFKPGNSPVTSVPELLVIDGQQRLTSISLLLLALTNYMRKNGEFTVDDESWEEIQDTYLLNKHKKDDSKYKLLLTRNDKESLINLVEMIDDDNLKSKRIDENYHFFLDKITKENAVHIYNGIRKLIIVDVILERDKDNPQLIFESLNSTGLDLSQADLIRNYVLMRQSVEVQNELYSKYWYPMEQSFGDKINQLAWFIRDYLTLKNAAIPKFDEVYDSYKAYLKDNYPEDVETAISDLYNYSKRYVKIALRKEEDVDLLVRFKEIAKLRMDVSFPLLMAVYNDYDAEIIDKKTFSTIIDYVKSYVFRRAICGIPTNSLNKTFATLYKRINPDKYLESISAEFLLLDSYRRYPNDAEFKESLQLKDVYNFRNRNYLLEELENQGRKELVNAENYTIEHILPQNENVSEEWKSELGTEWKYVKEKYLHTLGNLTLTAYNSELSDRPFTDKKNIDGGFKLSPLVLNDMVRVCEVWNEEAINNRAKSLANKASKIWIRPQLEDNILEDYKPNKNKTNGEQYSIDTYEYLKNDTLELYKHFEKRVLNIDSSAHRVFTKLYIAFKAQSNFVDVIPQKARLLLSLNIDYSKINDPENRCKDVTGKGRWGNGNVEVGLSSLNELDAVMELVKQAFMVQVD